MMSQLFTMLKSGGFAVLVAVVSAMVTVFAMTKDTETVPFGVIASLYVLPAILVFVILSTSVFNPMVRHIGYWVVTALILAYFYYLYLQSSGSAISDGSDRMAILTISSIAAGSIMAYITLVFIKFSE